MLGGDENVEDSSRLEVLSLLSLLVLNDDLRFAVRSQPWDFSILSLPGHLLVDSAGELMGQRVESLLVPFVSGVAEHDALVSSSNVFQFLVTDDSVSNVSVLGLHNLDDVHLFTTHATGPRVEADSSDGLASNSFKVNLIICAGDFSHQTECFRFSASFHGDSGSGVYLNARVDDSIRDLIAHLIGMSFSDRLRSKVDVAI